MKVASSKPVFTAKEPLMSIMDQGTVVYWADTNVPKTHFSPPWAGFSPLGENTRGGLFRTPPYLYLSPTKGGKSHRRGELCYYQPYC
jgi:hypothetical protein